MNYLPFPHHSPLFNELPPFSPITHLFLMNYLPFPHHSPLFNELPPFSPSLTFLMNYPPFSHHSPHYLLDVIWVLEQTEFAVDQYSSNVRD